MTTEQGVRRSVLREVLRGVMEEARSRSASLGEDPSDRHYYLGVALAAADEVHPERAEARPDDWLDSEDLAFREGYLAMQARIAALVMSGVDLPSRIHLPEPR